MRWQQFDALISGGAPMPETGFAASPVLSVAGDAGGGRKAVEWALDAARPRDLRQLALVFDWCGPVMTTAQSDALADKI